MSSLREIKDRIGSVRSTLKITSAMKLVASAKLRKAQKAIEGLRPYEKALSGILSSLAAGGCLHDGTSASLHPSQTDVWAHPVHMDTGGHGFPMETAACRRVAVVAMSSNSSLCGSFNANVIKRMLETVRQYESEGFEVEVHSLGRKMADAMRKAGYVSPADYTSMIGHPSYGASSALAKDLSARFDSGDISKVVLVYNHFVSSSKQEVKVEQYLPFEVPSCAGDGVRDPDRFIIEPGADAVAEVLIPQVLTLKFHAAVLDSQAAEQAARTIAMQTASDNAEELLSQLTLEYNKGRQQKITSEILDLLGGAAQ